MPRILVVDDHAVFRRRVVQAIAKSFPGATVDEAANGQQALTLVGTRRYALVLLDITMPGRGGLEVLREMKCHCRGVPVLMLSMHPEGEYADSAEASAELRVRIPICSHRVKSPSDTV